MEIAVAVIPAVPHGVEAAANAVEAAFAVVVRRAATCG
jgi:sulfur relay (sulfurtransferase) DsrF/TusC family protein